MTILSKEYTKRLGSMPGFDEAYYIANHPDVLTSKDQPLQHYLNDGWKKGYNPSRGFDTKWYLAANPDVKSRGINPLIHYVEFGLAEGRAARASYSQINAAVCPICSETCNRSIPAVTASFFRARCGIPENQETRSFLCEACEHVFFSPAPTSEQLARFYTGYNTDAYHQHRLSFEPGYADHLAATSGQNAPHWGTRRRFYESALEDFLDLKGVVVDYGGGDGRIARETFPLAEIVVVDVSFAGDLDAELARCAFFFCAHTFEHVPEPGPIMLRVEKKVRRGVPAWIEIPRQYTGKITSVFAGLEEDIAAGRPVSSPLTIMHEHIAHFSRKSLATLATRFGLTPQHTTTSDFGLLGILATKN